MARAACPVTRLPGGVRIIDAEAQARKHRSFEIPAKEARTDLRPGDFAKLVFRRKGAGERMWVQVHQAERGCYRGELDSEPVVLPLEPGRPIQFTPRNIIQIMPHRSDVLTIGALVAVTGAIGLVSLIRYLRK